ncbi:MAG: HSP40/DnaJ peptide-binding protein [Bacteroidales bacterium]|nr:HSP40/DnaJ peptide-binding protein [Bacteroidales bacterium]
MRDGKNNTDDFYTRTAANANKKDPASDDFDFNFDFFKKKGGEYSDFFNNFFKNSDLFKGDDFTGSITISLKEAYTGSKRVLNILNNKLGITIKPGIKDDQLLKIPEQGYPGIAGGKKGDLYVRVKVEKDNIFTRRGDELFTEIFVDIFKVMLGGDVIIQTLSGDVKIKIPQAIEYGKQLRIKGKGMPVYGADGLFGDLFVKIKYYIPKNLTDKQMELIRQAADNKQ